MRSNAMKHTRIVEVPLWEGKSDKYVQVVMSVGGITRGVEFDISEVFLEEDGAISLGNDDIVFTLGEKVNGLVGRVFFDAVQAQYDAQEQVE